MNLTQVARLLGHNRDYLKGRAHGLGIQIDVVGRQRVISMQDFERLKAAVAQDDPAITRKLQVGRRRPATAGA